MRPPDMISDDLGTSNFKSWNVQNFPAENWAEYKTYLAKMGDDIQPVPPRLHQTRG